MATTIVNQPYSTAGNGGRKLVQLSNGWLVAGTKDSYGGKARLYISRDNGDTWSDFYTASVGSALKDVAIATYGDKVFLLYSGFLSTAFRPYFFSLDNDGNQIGFSSVDSNLEDMRSISLAINEGGTELYAVWSSKNSVYPNNFNARYAKGTINANGSVAWGSVVQVTKASNSVTHMENLSIISINNNPFIFMDYKGSSPSRIFVYSPNIAGSDGMAVPTGWGARIIYENGSHVQSSPCALVKKYGSNVGRIIVGWHGTDSTDKTKQNVRIAYSDDEGATWIVIGKITSGNIIDRKNITLTEDRNGDVYAVYEDDGVIKYQICRNRTTVFGELATIETGTNPSSIDNAVFSSVPVIYMSENSVKVQGGFNDPPTVTLTSPADNLVLTEGNSYQITGSVTDADDGDVVTVKYKINNESPRNITASVSDGSTPIPFSKTLTYVNNRLYDGQTPVTPILSDQDTHTLTVWAEDNQGGKSPDEIRHFTVLYNQPPQISGQDEDLGSISAPPSIQYSVTDAEGYSFTVTEAVDGTTIRTYPGVDGQQETLTIPNDIWITLQPGVEHQLTITATDQYNASSKRTYTFVRTVDGIELVTNTPLPADEQPNRMVLTLNGQYSPNDLQVLVCNNGFDVNPTWEDATQSALNNRPYVFTNTVKTAADWGILIKIILQPGA